MNTERLDHLLREYFDADIGHQEMAELDALLQTRPEVRERFWQEAHVHSAMRDWGTENRTSLEIKVTTSPKKNRVQSRWLQWRPLTAAAAGIVFGMLCTSVVFGYAMPRVGKAVTLLHESFEDASLKWAEGFPTKTGQWSGDTSRVISGDGAVRPKEGAHMLRMEPTTMELFGRAHYVVDLTRHALPAGLHQVVLTASLRPEATDRRSRYVLRAAAFDEELANIDPRWMKEGWAEMDEHALAHSARGVAVAAGKEDWQPVRLTIDVPPGARILVVSFWAATMEGKIENRHAHFLDDVRLICVPQENLP